MTRNLKALGLALAAVFAMSAIVSSSASASTAFHFTGPAGVTSVKAAQVGTDVFTTDSGKVSCLHATYAGSVTGPTAASIKVTPTYSECHIIVLFTFSVTIHTNGCEYVFKPVTKTAGGVYEGTVDIECPVGKQIVVTAPGCQITVGSQTGLKTVTFKEVGAGATTEVEVNANLTGIDYVEDNTGGFCENNGKTTTNGTYVGKALSTGTQSNVHVGIGYADT